MAFRDQTALVDRARAMAARALNGLRQVRVTLATNHAVLEAAFWNDHEVAALVADPTPPARLFPITGGARLRGGPGRGLVQVTSVAQGADSQTLVLAVAPIGDYSTYTLAIDHANIDPLFASISFKFRPGCFSIDCAPAWTPSPKPEPTPPFDSLARDYESFRHALVVAMQKRVPGWAPTSDADLSVTLIDLFAAAADELADVQDRVMNEAYLATARKRVSLARHARLVDYYIHEGNQASTLLALRTSQDAVLPAGFAATTHPDAALGTTFVSVERTPVRVALGDVRLYTWSDVVTALAAGDTSADLAFATIADADAYVAQVEEQLQPESGLAPPRLVVAQARDPETGSISSRDPERRQLLRLTSAARVTDPQAPAVGIVRVTWRRDDALRSDYCFVEPASPTRPRVEDVSLFHGNLVLATSGTVVTQSGLRPISTRWGNLVSLRADLPVLYTTTPPDGTTPTRSTVAVEVVTPAGVDREWSETISLVHSDPSEKHFMIETDEQLRAVLRFGTGTNGKALPDGATVTATWRAGRGLEGNIGRDRLTVVVTAGTSIIDVWNPFDAVDGRAPEPAAEIRRSAPEAYRARQLRAVTLADYVARAEEIDKVQRAAAQYLWTGSWRTVRVTIDPLGGEVLDPQLSAEVAAHLEPLRLIGEDLEIRPPVYVPLRVALTVCLRDDVWPEDVRFAILEELSDGYTSDGRRALFHADNWTFGQSLHESEIAGRMLKVPGVEHIAKLAITRWDAASPGDGRVVEVAANEIISVRNDPDHMERGFVELVLAGGRT